MPLKLTGMSLAELLSQEPPTTLKVTVGVIAVSPPPGVGPLLSATALGMPSIIVLLVGVPDTVTVFSLTLVTVMPL